jgi:hypothetical protein
MKERRDQERLKIKNANRVVTRKDNYPIGAWSPIHVKIEPHS